MWRCCCRCDPGRQLQGQQPCVPGAPQQHRHHLPLQECQVRHNTDTAQHSSSAPQQPYTTDDCLAAPACAVPCWQLSCSNSMWCPNIIPVLLMSSPYSTLPQRGPVDAWLTLLLRLLVVLQQPEPGNRLQRPPRQRHCRPGHPLQRQDLLSGAPPHQQQTHCFDNRDCGS